MTDSAVDRQKYYENTKDFFSRFSEQKGLNIDQLKDPDVRIQLIKQLSVDQFLDLMTVANTKLRGDYKRWKRDYQGQDNRAVITSGLVVSPDLDPPLNSEKEFTSFFEEMKSNLTVENISLWATKLYTAIIFLHMFPDGNGRLGRNAFAFLSEGTFADEGHSVDRPSLIENFCEQINLMAVENCLDANNCTQFKYKQLGGLKKNGAYKADERVKITSDDESSLGLVARLKFIAAKRAGILNTRAKNSDIDSVCGVFGNGEVFGFEGEADEFGYGTPYEIITQPWTPEEIAAFNKQYEDVRSEWFKESIKVVDENAELCQVWLEIATTVPNPLFLKINILLRIINALSTGDSENAKSILDNDKFSSSRTDEEKTNYLTQLSTVLDQKSDLKDKVKKLMDRPKSG